MQGERLESQLKMLKPTTTYLLLFASFAKGTGEKPNFLMTCLFLVQDLLLICLLCVAYNHVIEWPTDKCQPRALWLEGGPGRLGLVIKEPWWWGEVGSSWELAGSTEPTLIKLQEGWTSHPSPGSGRVCNQMVVSRALSCLK